MGMYTTAVDADDKHWQFYAGEYGDCEVYRIGQPIPPEHIRPDPRCPGDVHLGDGVYDASGDGGDGWVVINGGVIVEIVPYALNEDLDKAPSDLSLIKKWLIQPPNFDLWTTEQWAEKAKDDARRKHKTLMQEADMEGMTAEERLAYLGAASTRAQLAEQGFQRRILPIDEP